MKDRFLVALRAGASIDEAAAHAGITDGDLAELRGSDFEHEIRAALVARDLALKAALRSAAKVDWRAAAFLLRESKSEREARARGFVDDCEEP